MERKRIMKNKVLLMALCGVLALALILPLTACAKEIQVEKEQISYNGNNEIVSKNVCTYDNKGNKIQDEFSLMENGTFKLNSVYKYAYNDDNNEISYEYYTVKDDGSQVLDSRIEKEYDGKLLMKKKFYAADLVNGGMVLNYQDTYTYDNKGRELSVLTSEYNAEEQMFINITIYENTYNTDFETPSKVEVYDYVEGVKAEQYSSKFEYQLDAKGNIISFSTELLSDDEVMKNIDFYTYNEEGLELGTVSYNIDATTGAYSISYMTNSTYIDGKYEKETTSQYFEDGVVMSADKLTYEYDKNHNITKVSMFDFDLTTQEYVLFGYQTFTFETLKI